MRQNPRAAAVPVLTLFCGGLLAMPIASGLLYLLSYLEGLLRHGVLLV
jgi:hypothetical protein